jgi:hypothetical protein
VLAVFILGACGGLTAIVFALVELALSGEIIDYWRVTILSRQKATLPTQTN